MPLTNAQKAKLKAEKAEITKHMKQQATQHQQFTSHINHTISNLHQENQELEDISTKLAGKGAKKSLCNIL